MLPNKAQTKIEYGLAILVVNNQGIKKFFILISNSLLLHNIFENMIPKWYEVSMA
jgi:hypothetical protein